MRRTAKKTKDFVRSPLFFVFVSARTQHRYERSSTSFDSLLSTSLSEKRAQNEVALRQMKRLRLRVNFITLKKIRKAKTLL